MRLSSFRSPAVVIALASLVFADGDTPQAISDVLKLNANNFDQVVSSTSLILVEFFAPWYAISCPSV